MEKAVAIFVAGLGGVFIGMMLLYAAIRMTSLVTDRLARKKEAK
jgi:Na+-transporting methylmalonyl-CoA/oxaloacetate decarboxylase gamma subunit